jgi:hypothetical protein
VLNEEQIAKERCYMRSRWLRNGATRLADRYGTVQHEEQKAKERCYRRRRWLRNDAT